MSLAKASLSLLDMNRGLTCSGLGNDTVLESAASQRYQEESGIRLTCGGLGTQKQIWIDYHAPGMIDMLQLCYHKGASMACALQRITGSKYVSLAKCWLTCGIRLNCGELGMFGSTAVSLALKNRYGLLIMPLA